MVGKSVIVSSLPPARLMHPPPFPNGKFFSDEDRARAIRFHPRRSMDDRQPRIARPTGSLSLSLSVVFATAAMTVRMRDN